MTRLVNVSLSVSLVVGVAACSEGCAHEQVVDEPFATIEPLSAEDLEKWVWPNHDDRYVPLAEQQLVALEQLVALLVAGAETAELSARQRQRASTLAAFVGVELHHVTVEHDGRSVELWVVVEPEDDRCGRGAYLIRLGRIGRRHGGVELLLQAPHSRFDKHTGDIALRLLLEGDAGPPRALFINTAHRYRQLDGSRVKRKPPEANPADAAHNLDHPIARVTTRLLDRRKLAVIQLHGFKRSAAAGDPELIVSAGSGQPRKASAAVVERLRAALPERPAGHFGVDTDRLGALQNVQGHTARDARRCFVHIELSERMRELLLDDREVRRRFAGAVFGGEAEEFRGGCR